MLTCARHYTLATRSQDTHQSLACSCSNLSLLSLSPSAIYSHQHGEPFAAAAAAAAAAVATGQCSYNTIDNVHTCAPVSTLGASTDGKDADISGYAVMRFLAHKMIRSSMVQIWYREPMFKELQYNVNVHWTKARRQPTAYVNAWTIQPKGNGGFRLSSRGGHRL